MDDTQAEIFRDTGPGGVHDWSTGDWKSTKVLGPYAACHPRLDGRRAAARELMRWAGLAPGTAGVVSHPRSFVCASLASFASFASFAVYSLNTLKNEALNREVLHFTSVGVYAPCVVYGAAIFYLARSERVGN